MLQGSVSEDLVLDGKDFMLCIEAFGYTMPPGGACFGVAGKGVDAILLRQVDKFDSRIVKIKQIIEQAKMNAEKEITDKETADKKADDYKQELTMATRVNIKKLIEQSDTDWSLRAYLEVVAVSQAPREYEFLFEEKDIPPQLLSSRLLQPKELEVKEEKGRVVEADSFSGAYSLDQLKIFFRCFEKLAVDFPLALYISTPNHQIVDGYDRKKFILIDINYLPSLHFDAKQEDQHVKILNILISDKSEATIFQTEILVLNEHLAVLKEQLKKLHADPEWRTVQQVTSKKTRWVDGGGNSWLHVAAFKGDVKLIKTLLLYGANPNLANHNGTTPLYLATQYGRTDCVQLLLENKAESNQEDLNGNTALQNAITHKRIKEMRLLLKYGARFSKSGFQLANALLILSPEDIEKISDQIKLIVTDKGKFFDAIQGLSLENFRALVLQVEFKNFIKEMSAFNLLLNRCPVSEIPFLVNRLGQEHIKSIIDFTDLWLIDAERYFAFISLPWIVDLLKDNIKDDVYKLRTILNGIFPQCRVDFVTKILGVDFFRKFLKSDEKETLEIFEGIIFEKQLKKILAYQPTISTKPEVESGNQNIKESHPKLECKL